MRKLTAGLAALALAIAACSPFDTKHDILSKAEEAQTKADLEDVLGAPDDRNKVGPIETWTYRARDGEVVFVISGDRVRLKAAE